MAKKEVSNNDLAKMIDHLAVSTAKGFESIDKRFESVDKKFESIDKRFESVDNKLNGLQNQIGGLNNRIDDLALNRATKDEIYHLGLRVSKIEAKVGISKK